MTPEKFILHCIPFCIRHPRHSVSRGPTGTAIRIFSCLCLRLGCLVVKVGLLAISHRAPSFRVKFLKRKSRQRRTAVKMVAYIPIHVNYFRQHPTQFHYQIAMHSFCPKSPESQVAWSPSEVQEVPCGTSVKAAAMFCEHAKPQGGVANTYTFCVLNNKNPRREARVSISYSFCFFISVKTNCCVVPRSPPLR